MKKLVLLFSHEITDEQKEDAREKLNCEKIVELDEELKKVWQNIEDRREKERFKKFLEKNTEKGDYVLVQGEWGITYDMVNFCKELGLIPIYSSTKREVKEKKEGETIIKTSIFKHRGFIRY